MQLTKDSRRMLLIAHLDTKKLIHIPQRLHSQQLNFHDSSNDEWDHFYSTRNYKLESKHFYQKTAASHKNSFEQHIFPH